MILEKYGLARRNARNQYVADCGVVLFYRYIVATGGQRLYCPKPRKSKKCKKCPFLEE